MGVLPAGFAPGWAGLRLRPICVGLVRSKLQSREWEVRMEMEHHMPAHILSPSSTGSIIIICNEN